MKVVESEHELGHVELDVLFGEHDLLGEATEQIAAAQEVQHQVELALGLKCLNYLCSTHTYD